MLTRMWRAILLIGATLALLLAAELRSPDSTPMGTPSAPLPLRIAAAADLRFALDELIPAYRKEHPGVEPEVTYGSSGMFYAQILNGAPFDLFMSADLEYPRQLATRGLTVPGSEFIYGAGQLAVWIPMASPLDVEKKGLDILGDPRIAHVAIANPAHAPYGRAAEAAMRAANVYEGIRTKLVLGENVAQALQFVQSGSADVGVVALSLVISPTMKDAGRYSIVPAKLYPALEQGGVVLRTDGIDRARDFRKYLLGDTARDVLKRYGFDRSES